MQTELAKKLGIEFPIFAFTHCRDVVVAVSKAGGFGVLGAVGFTPEQLETELTWIDENIGDLPYGVDIVIPGKYEGMGATEGAYVRWPGRELLDVVALESVRAGVLVVGVVATVVQGGLIGAGYGAAGERCMAIPLVVAVGDATAAPTP